MNRVGRYDIVGRLGRGGMGMVYKARAPLTGRIVALKILDPRDELFVDLAGEDRLREVFVEEARIMGSIAHAHVAEVIDCDEHEGRPFIVLEYYAHSLGSLIGEAYRVEQRTRMISVAKTSQYLIQALMGLERLHFSGIVHRDLKPFNLMLTGDDRIKIIDFGLSRVRGEERMSIPGMQVGSPFYASPEQERRPETADERADIYSVGVLAYRLLTGTLPAPGKGAVAPPSRLREDLGGRWDDVIMRSLAARPSQRYVSARQMRMAVDEVFADWSTATTEGCRFVEDDREPVRLPAVRDAARRILVSEIQAELNLDGLMRPSGYSSLCLQPVDDQIVRDPCNGLVWQREGSGFPLDWQQANEYVRLLNERSWEGRNGWRLPTLPELLSILQPPTVERDFCLPMVFSQEIHWLWSSDWCSRRQAWMVDIVECYVGRLDRDGAASVCAVCAI